MMDTKKNKKLFPQFEKFSNQHWVNEAVKRLKDQDFDSLYSSTYEGIDLKPFYTSSDQTQTLFVNDFHHPRTWLTREEISANQANEANQLALEAIQNGTQALHFDLQGQEATDIPTLLNDISPSKYTLGFSLDQHISTILEELPSKLSQGTLDFDFLTRWTETGEMPDKGMEDLARMILQTAHKAGLKCLVVTGGHFYNSGGNVVQELAFSLAVFVEYLDQLTERGIPAEHIIESVEFSMAIGNHYFMEISKLRALRLLWNHLCLQVIQDYSRCRIHSRTALWHKTYTDSYNNMLRNTTQAMSAIIGGCDSISIGLHNEAFAPSDAFARRIARNISTILREESFLDKVTDVAAGSYYVEHLTVALAEKAWGLFQEVEAKGGFVKAFKAGFIQEEIEKVARLKKEAVKDGREVIVGTNKFQNLEEKLDLISRGRITPSSNGLKLLTPYRVAEEIERN